MKKLLAALLIAAPMVLHAQVQTAIPFVTLDDAIRIAEENAPSMRQQRNSIRTQNLNLTKAYFFWLPTISTGVGYRPAQNGSRTNFSSNYSASLGSIFNLQSYLAISSAKRSRDLAQTSMVTATYSLRSNVKQQYYSILQAEESIANSRRQLDIARKNMELSRLRLSTGMVVRSDTLTNFISLQNSESGLISAEASLQNNIRTFSRTLGIENQVRPDPRDTADFKFVQLDSIALLGMLADAPAAVQSEAQVENAKVTVRNANLSYIPLPSGSNISINRSANGESMWGYTDKAYRYSSGKPSISFSFNFTIFDRFGREGTLRQAREGLETAQINFRDQQLNAVSSLLNQLSAIRNLERTMNVQLLSLAAAEENFRINEVRNDLGMLTEIEMTSSQNSLFTAQNNIINSRYQYRNLIAQLESLIGRDIR